MSKNHQDGDGYEEVRIPFPDLIKQAGRVIQTSVLSALLILAFYFAAGSIILSLIGNVFFNPKDDTDPAKGRSGLVIHTDCATGIQYVTTKVGGLTPRLGPDGQPLRRAC